MFKIFLQEAFHLNSKLFYSAPDGKLNQNNNKNSFLDAILHQYIDLTRVPVHRDEPSAKVVLYLDREYRTRSHITYAVYYSTELLRICMAEDRFSQASKAPLGTIIFFVFPSRLRLPAETPSRYGRNDLLIFYIIVYPTWEEHWVLADPI